MTEPREKPETLSPDEVERLRGHLEGIETVYIAPLRDRTDRGMPEILTAVVTIDALAAAHSDSGTYTEKWQAFTRHYLPATLDIPAWYDELRSRLLHHASAGPGLHFTNSPDEIHGRVTPSGGTVLSVGDFLSDTIDAFNRFSHDVLRDPDAARRALGYFDWRPPVRPVSSDVVGDVEAVSAAPPPRRHPKHKP